MIVIRCDCCEAELKHATKRLPDIPILHGRAVVYLSGEEGTPDLCHDCFRKLILTHLNNEIHPSV